MFQQLIQPLVDDGLVTNAADFLVDLERRENEITTQLEHGVAFPHARSMAVKRVALAIGIAPEPGIEFNPEATEPCRVFFLMAVPSFAPTAHFSLLRKLANFAHDEKQLAKFLVAKTPTQAIRCLTTFKG